MNPKVSIIVPIYNVEEYLSNCIQSILNQTFKNFELILINDGSTDKSLDICMEYKNLDSRIVVIDKKNGGVSAARNAGIKIARGDYIAFVDPDDDIHPNMYEILINTAINDNSDLVLCGIKYINERNNTVENSMVWNDCDNIIYRGEIEDKFIRGILINRLGSGYGYYSSVNKLYKKELFFENKVQFDENKSHSEDAQLNFKLLEYIQSISFVKKPLYNYYIRNRESLSQYIRNDMYEYIKDNRTSNLELCNRYGHKDISREIIQHYTDITIFYMIDIINSNKTMKDKIDIVSKIINDPIFINDIKVYECPYRYYKLLKMACIKKSLIIFIFLVKLLDFKERVIKNKGEEYED